MYNWVRILGVSLILTLPAFAIGADASGSSTPEKENKWYDSDDSERVCTRERVAGSHIPTRVCRTRAQLRAQEEASQRQLRDMESAPILNRPGPQ